MASTTEYAHHVITYYDGKVETLNVSEETWWHSTDNTKQTRSSFCCGLRSLERNKQQFHTVLLECFCNNPFLRHHVQGFDRALISDAFVAGRI